MYSRRGMKKEMQLNACNIKAMTNPKLMYALLKAHSMPKNLQIINDRWEEEGYHLFNLFWNRKQIVTKIYLLNKTCNKGVEVTYHNGKFYQLMDRFTINIFKEFMSDVFQNECGLQMCST